VRGAERGARVAARLAAVALVLVTASATYRLATVERRAHAVVIDGDGATVRFEPAASGTARFEARPGTVLRVLVEHQGWAQVARGDGERGWVERDALDVI
jgi:hypothetical protein